MLNCYELMYKDDIVINFSENNINNGEIVNEKLLPVAIKNGMPLDKWLKQRTADKSRISIRKLFATIKMNFGNDKFISQFRKPTDFYWIREKGNQKTFNSNIEDLHEISLNLSSVVPKNPINFETSNIGSYEKGWKSGNLLKSGSKNEIFSEILYSKISSKYVKTATYFSIKINNIDFICSPNFVSLHKDEFLVLADEWTFTGPEESLEEFFINFEEILDEEELKSLMIIHFLDVVMNNFDRHCQNFGFIYNEDNKRFLAPNFDFNLSIIGYNNLENLGENELPLSSYFELFDEIPNEVKIIPSLGYIKKEISSICKELDLEEEKYVKVANWILDRWKGLLEIK